MDPAGLHFGCPGTPLGAPLGLHLVIFWCVGTSSYIITYAFVFRVVFKLEYVFFNICWYCRIFKRGRAGIIHMILEFVRMYDPGFCIDSECICTMLLWAPLAPISGPPPQQPSPPPTPNPHPSPPTAHHFSPTGDRGRPRGSEVGI